MLSFPEPELFPHVMNTHCVDHSNVAGTVVVVDDDEISATARLKAGAHERL